MWLWSIYKNIFPRYLELHGCVILPSAVGVGQYSTSMQFKVPGNIFLYIDHNHMEYLYIIDSVERVIFEVVLWERFSIYI